MPHLFTNRLINESSPYLLQHAHNPVDWYPWGEEALQKARSSHKIILVSIGYAACHWCHVMEKESFENESVAALMNENFINIKIDREERPDLDHIYMDAVQAMSGSGGWPLNVFLTPEAKPFYGGTYFPPVKAYNRASWTDVLTGVQKAWLETENTILAQATQLTEHLQVSYEFGQSKAGPFTDEQGHTIFQNIMKTADTEWGGFGKAPKFPQTFTIQLLLQYHYFTEEKTALDQALLSIDKMLDGGIYDQVGGGLARYSTDREWLAPHFEKMLYDNALFTGILCEAYQVAGGLGLTQVQEEYEQAIRKTIGFIVRELGNPEGGFYAAIDADSEGHEGKYYVWQKKEVVDLLGNDAELFCEFYDISDKGNWEGTNILRIRQKASLFMEEKGIKPEVFRSKINNGLAILLSARDKRIRPLLDDKMLLNWNAMMITALCKAAAALKDKEYLELAEKTFRFLTGHFKTGNTGHGLHHTYKGKQAKHPAFLDDYACLIQSCIFLQELSSNGDYLTYAKELAGHVMENFMDEGSGFFFFTHKQQTDVIIRKKEVYDGATPSGNSIMAENLFYLSVIFDRPDWYQHAEKITSTLLNAVVRYPGSFGVWASVLLRQSRNVNEIVISGQNCYPLRDELLTFYMPCKILQCGILPDEGFPLLAGKNFDSGPLIYRCKKRSCEAPVKSLEGLFSLIRNSP